MRIKLKKNPPGITGLPTVAANLSANADSSVAWVKLDLWVKHPSGDVTDVKLVGLSLSPSEARKLAADMFESADTADRLLSEQEG